MTPNLTVAMFGLVVPQGKPLVDPEGCVFK